MRLMTRKVLLNTVAASSANLKSDATARHYYICVDNTANPLVNLLPGIPYGKIRAVSTAVSVAEVTKVQIIGRATETIAAGTRYALKLGSLAKKEGASTELQTYAYTAPTPLTTPAASALAQVNTALVNKINANYDNYVTAKLLTKVTFEAVAAVTSGMVVGEYVWQGATLGTNETWKGRIAYVDPTWSATTGQVLFVYDEVGTQTLTNSAVLKKGTSTGTAISAAAGAASTNTPGQAIGLIDDAGYFPADPNPREGETSAYIGGGFVTASVEVSRAAVYSQGVGADMLKRSPIFNWGTQELAGNANGTGVGDASFLTSELPVSGTFYRQTTIDVELNPSDNVMTGYSKGEILRYELWLAQSGVGATTGNDKDLTDSLIALVTG